MSTAQSHRNYDCPHCGAHVQSNWAECWLCHAPLDGQPTEAAEPTPRSTAKPPEQPVAGMLAIGAAVAAGVVVLIGVTALAPGLGVLMFLAIVPAVVRTALVTQKRGALGKETSRGQTVLMFMLSLVLTGAMLCVTAFIAFWTFCLTCVGAAAVTGFSSGNESTAIILASVVTLTIVGVLVWLFTKLVRKRYRQDIDKQ